jgi:hypothetical protein
LGRASFEDVLAGVGRGEIFSGDVVKSVYPDFKHEQAAGVEANLAEGGWFAMRKAQGLVFKDTRMLVVGSFSTRRCFSCSRRSFLSGVVTRRQ